MQAAVAQAGGTLTLKEGRAVVAEIERQFETARKIVVPRLDEVLARVEQAPDWSALDYTARTFFGTALFCPERGPFWPSSPRAGTDGRVPCQGSRNAHAAQERARSPG